MVDVIEEFNKMKQEGSVDEYLMRFEELKVSIDVVYSTLDEAYFVSNLTSGLNKEL